MLHNQPYRGALTREQWLFREICIVARLRLDEDLSDADIVERVVEQNLFQYPTERELKSIARALCRRLTALSDDPERRARLACLIAHGTVDQARQTNLYAIACDYRVMWEFMTVVVAPKRRQLDAHLPKREIVSFLEGLRAQDEKVAGWSDATLNKIRQVFVKCLEECGMYDRASEQLTSVLLDFELEGLVRANDDAAILPALGVMD